MFETCTWNISTLSWNLKIMHASVSVTTSEFTRERRFPPVTLYTFYWGETTLNLSHSNDSASLRRRRCYLSVDKQNTRPLCLLTFIACHINNPIEGWWEPPQASAIVLVPQQHTRPFNIPSSATKNKLYIPPNTHISSLWLWCSEPPTCCGTQHSAIDSTLCETVLCYFAVCQTTLRL